MTRFDFKGHVGISKVGVLIMYVFILHAMSASRHSSIIKYSRHPPPFSLTCVALCGQVTGRKELKYAWYKRIPYYFLSAAVTGVMLLVAFAVMVMSLNLQGYIRADAMGARYLHYAALSQYSEPGRWFDNLGGTSLKMSSVSYDLCFPCLT